MKTIFVNGLSGKMGKTIKNLILDIADFEIVKTISDSDLVIDFSRPESTMPLSPTCSTRRTAVTILLASHRSQR